MIQTKNGWFIHIPKTYINISDDIKSLIKHKERYVYKILKNIDI